jgi:hypothetical protein
MLRNRGSEIYFIYTLQGYQFWKRAIGGFIDTNTPSEVRWTSKKVTSDSTTVGFPAQQILWGGWLQTRHATTLNASKCLSNGDAQLKAVKKQARNQKWGIAQHFVMLLGVVVSCMYFGRHRSHSVGSLLGSLCHFPESYESHTRANPSDYWYNRRDSRNTPASIGKLPVFQSIKYSQKGSSDSKFASTHRYINPLVNCP